MNDLHKIALSAPPKSGVYIWRDENRTVIYVGKAKNLKNRLSSYFSGPQTIKTMCLKEAARSIEYVTTASDYEAFLLENTLIKKYSPRYNIALKDDKTYPVLCVTTGEKYPRIFKTRNTRDKTCEYFGPYPVVGALDDFIHALYAVYPIRHCKKLKSKKSPCLYYHLGQCLGPCCHDNKECKALYTHYIGEIINLLKQNYNDSEESEPCNNEITATKNNNIDNNKTRNQDYIGTMGKKTCEGSQDIINNDAQINNHVKSGISVIENKIRTAAIANDFEIAIKLRQLLSSYNALCAENSQTLFETNEYITHIADTIDKTVATEAMLFDAKSEYRKWLREAGDIDGMKAIQKVLGLQKLPRRIEGFDIAHIDGLLPVASLISFWDGNPDKANYRYFRLKTTDGKIDDFQSMREATARRYSRLLNEKKPLPDLILIDGGIGQVNAVSGVLKALELDIQIVGLAKKEEQLFLPYNSTPIALPHDNPGLQLLQRVRDETHRFATNKNQKLRTKRATSE